MPLITDENSRSVAKMFDLTLIDLATVFGQVIKPLHVQMLSRWSLDPMVH